MAYHGMLVGARGMNSKHLRNEFTDFKVDQATEERWTAEEENLIKKKEKRKKNSWNATFYIVYFNFNLTISSTQQQQEYAGRMQITNVLCIWTLYSKYILTLNFVICKIPLVLNSSAGPFLFRIIIILVVLRQYECLLPLPCGKVVALCEREEEKERGGERGRVREWHYDSVSGGWVGWFSLRSG